MRTKSRKTRRARRSGCASLLFLVVLVGGASALTWQWLSRHNVLLMPTAPPDRLSQALAAFREGNLNGAITAARAELLQKPDQQAALVLLIRALVYRSYSDYDRAQDRRSALSAAEAGVERAPDDADARAAYAFALQADEQPGAAADAARRALDIAPEHRFARTALALAYAVAGSPDVARRESTRAAEGARGDEALDALRALAISYGDQGDSAQALQTIGAAQQINPRLVALQFEQARYAMQRSDTDTATIAYYQVLVIDPENVKARYRLCEVSSILREHAAALTYCQGVIDRAPGWADGWYLAGREYFLNGDFREAADHLHQCARLQTTQNIPIPERRFECWYLQGQAAEVIGDCDLLRSAYAEFQAMDASADIPQSWVYPPEGPPGCG